MLLNSSFLPHPRSGHLLPANRVNKKTLVKKILARLTAELALYGKAAHEQSKAENKYDTRGLEASYLARGQSRQAGEVEQAIEQFQALVLRTFAPADPIDLGALVELETRGERIFYFIGPRAGGTEIEHEKHEVTVITPPSPLGKQLVGRRQGDKLKLNIGGNHSEYRVIAVS